MKRIDGRNSLNGTVGFVTLLVLLFFYASTPLIAQKVGEIWSPSEQEELKVLQEIAHKYSGANRVELFSNIVLKPDIVVYKNGFVMMMFKGAAKGKNEFEESVIYPLNKIRKINGQEVDQLSANYTLGMVYLYKHKDYRRAAECYEKILELNPPKTIARIAYENLGFCYNQHSVQNFERCIELTQQAIKIFPDDEKLWFNLGTAYFGKGNMEEMLRCYDKVFKMAEDSLSAGLAHGNLGSIYYHLGEMEKARIHLEKAKEILEKENKKEVLKKILLLLQKVSPSQQK